MEHHPLNQVTGVTSDLEYQPPATDHSPMTTARPAATIAFLVDLTVFDADGEPQDEVLAVTNARNADDAAAQATQWARDKFNRPDDDVCINRVETR